MNVCISKDLLFEVAKEMEIHPSFVEKDWVIVCVMKAVGNFVSADGISCVLGGGTSLSKAHQLIKRFSEDLDFKIVDSGSIRKCERRRFRHAFIDEIGKIEGFSINNIRTRDEGRNCSFEVDFSSLTDTPYFLRKKLKVEIYFDSEKVGYEKKQIKSFISEYMNHDFDVELNCVSPFYTAVDKFCALMWRLFEKKTIADYTLLRHLHDLCALSEYCTDRDAFSERALKIFEIKDKKRISKSKIDNKIDFVDVICSTCDKLQTLPIYREEYRKYVESMSYVLESEYITYDAAFSNLQKIAQYFI